MSLYRPIIFDRTELSFNNTNLPEARCRAKLIEYSKNLETKDVKTFTATIKPDLIITIEASSRLSCVIILADNLNENLICVHPVNNFSDIEIKHVFTEIILIETNKPHTEYITIEEIFNHKFIDKVVEKYINNMFTRYSIKTN